MGIISKPGLPQGKVNTVLMSNTEKEGRLFLENMGINVLETCNSGRLSAHVSHHPDMLFLHLFKNKCVVLDKDSLFIRKLKNMGFSVYGAENQYAENYPYDIGLNCVIINNCVIGKLKYVDEVVKRELNGYRFINVKQGYTKCSVCIVNEESIITEDESIYRALCKDFDVLKIQSQCVELNGYNYGFFGGCTGLIDKNLLAVNGELKYHKSYNAINGFLKDRGIDIVELKRGNLTDIGSIIPLKEI